MLIHVTPEYGFGWTDGLRTLDPPAAFNLEMDEWDSESPSGVVSTPGHDLTGYHFTGSPRHLGSDFAYNCTLAPGASPPDASKPTLHGYCSIGPPPVSGGAA